MCRGIFDLTQVMPGWACCRCRLYNGLQRLVCRRCDALRHNFEIPENVKLCACGFGYRPGLGEDLKTCPACGEGLAA